MKRITLLGTLFLSIFWASHSEAKDNMDTLNAKDRQVAVISIYTAKGDMPNLRNALNAGLDAGLTVNEIKEILIQLYAYCGFPRSIGALGNFMTVLNEREAKGVKDAAGRLPGPLPTGKSVEFGAVNQRKLFGRDAQGAVLAFAPAIDEYLKAHLFGDIFSRDNLDWRTRELATVAALASMNGVQNELNAHGIRDGILADLGCGTGELTLMLTQAGYDMIGIDQSEEMLCVVRDKAEQLGLSGKLLLLQQDLLKLDLYGTIRGAVSTFDTFNHIPDLDTAIANAAFFMEEGGVFLFDMNTPYKHQKVLGENVFTFEEEDAACVWRNHYHPADRRVEITVDIDYRETGEHFHEQFYEYTYDLDTIRAALEKHGFVLEKVCDGESFGPLTEESERYFFCAVKQYTQLEEKENV